LTRAALSSTIRLLKGQLLKGPPCLAYPKDTPIFILIISIDKAAVIVYLQEKPGLGVLGSRREYLPGLAGAMLSQGNKKSWAPAASEV